VCCSVLQCVAVCCSVLQCAAVCCSVLQCAAVCCSVVQCVAVCCSVLQCVAVTTWLIHTLGVHCSAVLGEVWYLLSTRTSFSKKYTNVYLRTHLHTQELFPILGIGRCEGVEVFECLTHSYVWRDSFISVTWRIHMCDMTHSYVCL